MKKVFRGFIIALGILIISSGASRIANAAEEKSHLGQGG